MSDRTAEEQVMDKKLSEIRSNELKKYGVEISPEDVFNLSNELYRNILQEAKEEYEKSNPPKQSGPSADDIFKARCDTLISEGFTRDFDVYSKGEVSVSVMQIRALSDKNFAALFEPPQPKENAAPQTDVEHDKFAFQLFMSNLNQLNLPAIKMDKSKVLVGKIEEMRKRMIEYIEKHMA